MMEVSHLRPAPVSLWSLGGPSWWPQGLHPPSQSCCSVWCWDLSWVWVEVACGCGWSLHLLHPLNEETGIGQWNLGWGQGVCPVVPALSWNPSWNVSRCMLRPLLWQHLHQSWPKESDAYQFNQSGNFLFQKTKPLQRNVLTWQFIY